MNVSPTTRVRGLLGAVALLAAAAPAGAQMTPLTDVRQLSAHVDYHGLTDQMSKTPPGFFADWEDFATAQVDDPVAGSSNSEAYQITQFHPAGLYYAGSSSGSWYLPSGTYNANSTLDWTVQTSSCLAYTLHAEVVPSDPAGGTCYVRMSSGGIDYVMLTDGIVDRTGQMPAGQYRFEGKSAFGTSVENFSGGTYSLTIFCSACAGTLISGQPRDTTVQCDVPARFCVTPAASGGPFTYQWYGQSGPLPENGHFTGVNTSCLSIQHACWADVGNYAVVVTSTGSGIVETSKYAHLSISSIAVGVGAGALAFELGPAMPNPFTAATVLRYQAPAPFFARVAVYDAAGHLVRRIADRMLEASGTLTWDGRTTSGAPAVPGIYFVRFEGSGRTETRRLALVR